VSLEFKCSRCSAPLTYTPESIFSVCEYCGYVYWFDEGARVNIFAAPSKPREVIISSFWSRMRMDRDMGRCVDMISMGFMFHSTFQTLMWMLSGSATGLKEGGVGEL